MQVTWKEAKNYCLQNGMDLAVIETFDKAKQVADAAQIKSSELFLINKQRAARLGF